MVDLSSPLAVVAEAAGAANIIIAWLARHPMQVRPFMAGPAADLWTQRFADVPLLPDLEMALDGAASLLSGTGWSNVEHQARAMARERGIPSVAVLDHWVNYRPRFERNGEFVPADALWVTDEHGLALAQRDLPEMPALLQPNYYVVEQAARIAAAGATHKQHILYLLEPFGSDWGRDQPGEFQALDYLLAELGALGLPPSTPVHLRPHPTDPPGKYDAWIARQVGRNVRLDQSPDLATAMAGAEYVAGCQTFALVIALAAGLKAVCTLPPWAPPCVLPHAGLLHLQKIASPPR